MEGIHIGQIMEMDIFKINDDDDNFQCLYKPIIYYFVICISL